MSGTAGRDRAGIRVSRGANLLELYITGEVLPIIGGYSGG